MARLHRNAQSISPEHFSHHPDRRAEVDRIIFGFGYIHQEACPMTTRITSSPENRRLYLRLRRDQQALLRTIEAFLTTAS